MLVKLTQACQVLKRRLLARVEMYQFKPLAKFSISDSVLHRHMRRGYSLSRLTAEVPYLLFLTH